jgi:outer membrane lipoprotein carrier protein
MNKAVKVNEVRGIKKFVQTALMGISVASLSLLSNVATATDKQVSNLSPINKSEVTQVINSTDEFKNELMNKLKGIDQFSALFEQVIIDNQGNVLQQGGGDLSVKRPNLVRWNTVDPDESLIVSDGQSIFLYDPFIEQVTAYKLDGAIANTPILLITTDSTAMWDQYSVERLSTNKYLISANDQESRIKSLEILFNAQNELSGFTFLDVTGQLSKISLKEADFGSVLAPSMFNFVMPEGVLLDDQR